MPPPSLHLTYRVLCRDGCVHERKALGETSGCEHTETSQWDEIPSLSSTCPRASHPTSKLQVCHVNGHRVVLGHNFHTASSYPLEVSQSSPCARSSELQQWKLVLITMRMKFWAFTRQSEKRSMRFASRGKREKILMLLGFAIVANMS